MKGRSISVASEAEVKKSRSVSNSRSRLANAPAEPLRERSCMSSRWSKMRRPICRSALCPASSMKVERNIFTTKSTTIAITTPIVSATSESMAWAGRMRSYTTMMKIEVVSARMLVSTAASATCT